MAGSSAPSKQSCHLRSTSTPSISHPTALKVEEELQKLRTLTSSSSSSTLTSADICNALRVLGELYHSVDDLLHLPSIQQAFFHPNQTMWLEKEMDMSVELLDLCNTIKDELAIVEERLQLAHRKRGRTAEEKLYNCIWSNKKTQKIIKKSQKALKQLENVSRSCRQISEDSELLTVVRVQKETKEITISLLCSILSLMSMPKPKPRASTWFSVSKVMYNGKVLCGKKNDDGGELECVSFKDVEDGLECLFRQQIQNRVSLLNILSL